MDCLTVVNDELPSYSKHSSAASSSVLFYTDKCLFINNIRMSNVTMSVSQNS